MKFFRNLKFALLVVFYLFSALLLFNNFFLLDSIVSVTGRILLFFLFLAVFTIFLLLAIEDLKTHEISANLAYLGATACVIINIITFFGLNTSILWSENYFFPLQNILMGVFAGFFVYLLVLASQEKAIGRGDIILFFLSGSLLGFNKFLAGFYITIFLATIYALIKALLLKRFKGIEIPFIPFIYAGTITAFLISSETFREIVKTIFPIF